MADDNFTVLRRCTRCEHDKPATLEFFPPHKPGKYGLHSRCRPCKKIDDAERRARPDQQARQQAWRDANKGAVREYNAAYRAAGYKSTRHVAEWRARNLEHCRAYGRLKMRRYYAANPEKYRAATRRHYARNREAVIAYRVMRYRTDPAYNLKHRIAVRLRKMLRKQSRGKDRLLGFTGRELVAHIERQFTKGMTWDRLLAGEIHIDHIVPVRTFNIREAGDAEFRACWSLGNLRPMWAKENQRKSGKLLTLL